MSPLLFLLGMSLMSFVLFAIPSWFSGAPSPNELIVLSEMNAWQRFNARLSSGLMIDRSPSREIEKRSVVYWRAYYAYTTYSCWCLFIPMIGILGLSFASSDGDREGRYADKQAAGAAR